MLTALQQILASLGVHTDITTFLVLFGLIFSRLAGAMTMAPFLGGKSASSRIKVGLAAMITMLLFPTVAPDSVSSQLTTLFVMCLLIKEVLIGFTLGFLSQLVFFSIQMAGATVDYGRGMSQATFLAPQLEANVSVTGQLQFQAALVLFLVLNGHLLFLRALADSFRFVPLLEFPKFSGGTLPAAELVARYTAESLVVAVQLSAPALIALFLVDISFGMLGKVASGLRVHGESQPVKALVGLGVVFLAIAYTMNRMPEAFSQMLRGVDQFMQRIR